MIQLLPFFSFLVWVRPNELYRGSRLLSAWVLIAKPLILLAVVSWALVSPARNMTVDKLACIAVPAILSVSFAAIM